MLGRDPTLTELARWLLIAVLLTAFGLGLLGLSYLPPSVIRAVALVPLALGAVFGLGVWLGWNRND